MQSVYKNISNALKIDIKHLDELKTLTTQCIVVSRAVKRYKALSYCGEKPAYCSICIKLLKIIFIQYTASN